MPPIAGSVASTCAPPRAAARAASPTALAAAGADALPSAQATQYVMGDHDDDGSGAGGDDAEGRPEPEPLFVSLLIKRHNRKKHDSLR